MKVNMTKKELTNIMEQVVSPQQLACQQLKTYVSYITNLLREIINSIENYEFDEPKSYLSDSPAGDGYGQDNMYIDFGFGEHSIDINEALEYCKHLRDIATGEISADDEFYFQD